MLGVSTERKTVQGAQRPGADAEKDEDGRGGVAGRGGGESRRLCGVHGLGAGERAAHLLVSASECLAWAIGFGRGAPIPGRFWPVAG